MPVTTEMLEQAKSAAQVLLTEEQQGTGTTCTYERFSETPTEILLMYRRSNPAWIVESHAVVTIVYNKSTGTVTFPAIR
ncbi:MAG: hypothetical protein HOP15_00080 [Planctomycetes bacterium]|nr:hypothetical protein [Planctomycetota bacterium]